MKRRLHTGRPWHRSALLAPYFCPGCRNVSYWVRFPLNPAHPDLAGPTELSEVSPWKCIRREIFFPLAKSKTFTRASEKCHVSRPLPTRAITSSPDPGQQFSG